MPSDQLAAHLYRLPGNRLTALAQVMKYHEWPEHGTGSITYTDVNRITRTMDFDVAFDWDNMLDVYDKTATTVQNDAVALLMKACGHAVQD